MEQHYSARSGHRVSDTQCDSYHAISIEELTGRQAEVMSLFEEPGVLLTREEISARTNQKLSSICGRTRELIDAGRLTVDPAEKRWCMWSNRHHELLRVPTDAERAAFFGRAVA